MTKVSLLLALLVAASPLAALAESQNEIATNLPGINTIAAPPQGFDPLRASDADLNYYGFPPRPSDNSGDFASWAKAMAASKERIIPVLEQTNILHGPARNPSAVNGKSLKSDNWSGYVNLGPAKSYGKSSWSYIYSDVTVPTAAAAVCNDVPDYGVAWVGIDGWDSKDVLQDGIEFDAVCYKGQKATLYSAWFEWFPLYEVRISGMPIAPGQEYYMEVWSTSSTKGHAYLVNLTKGKAVTITFGAPKGTKLIGNSAEWITERPGENGKLANLTNYGSQKYKDAHAESFSSVAIDPGDSIPTIMYDNNGKAISYPTLSSATAFTMKDEGSAK